MLLLLGGRIVVSVESTGGSPVGSYINKANLGNFVLRFTSKWTVNEGHCRNEEGLIIVSFFFFFFPPTGLVFFN